MTISWRKKILIVEDDPTTATLESRILEKNGYEVILASTGEEAVQRTDEHPDVNLILMDIDLGPGIKGTAAAERILKKHGSIPLAFLSSHTDREMVELTEGITSYGYILKSAGPVVLLASIKMAFRLHAARMAEEKHREELKASEQRYRELFELNPMPMWVYDLETLDYLAVNDAACYCYGYSREEFLSMTLLDIRPPEEAEAVKAKIAELARAEPGYSSSGIWKHIRRDGTSLFAEVTGHHIEFKGRRARLVLARDVTARLAAEQEVQRQLAEKEDLLRQSYHRARSHIRAMEEMLRLRAHDIVSTDGQKVILETMNRISGLRLLYDRLLIAGETRSTSVTDYLDDLGRAVLKAYSHLPSITLQTSMEEVNLGQKQILGLGAATNELITHSLHTAFRGRTEGTIRMELKNQGDDIIFSVSDDGERWTLAQWEEGTETFGLSVVLLVAEQLGGSLGVEPDNGNRVILRFPATEPDIHEISSSVSQSPLSERFRSVIEAVNQM